MGKNLVLAILAVALFGGAYAFWTSANNQNAAEAAFNAAGGGLSEIALKGRNIFNSRCATCHGYDAGGGQNGPPLIHEIYEPSHHGDATFHLAVQNGVRAHHWQFGDMPPQPGVKEADVDAIIAFVRETQRANGIF